MENNGKATALNYAMLAGVIFGGPIASTVLQNAGGILGGLAMMKFSRGAEGEADKLGVQYMYKAGYDPTATVSFFEKLQAKESARPGTVSKLFSTHPQTGDRIAMSKKNIGLILPDKDQYVVTTSEFNQVKAFLTQLENRRSSPEEANKPSLRRRTQQPDATSKDGDDNDETTTSRKSSKDKKDISKESEVDSTKPEDREPNDDDRPKLKRRD